MTLLADYKDRYGQEWGRRDRIHGELRVVLVVAVLALAALARFVAHLPAVLTESLRWPELCFLAFLFVFAILFVLGSRYALSILWSPRIKYNFLCTPAEEVEYWDRMKSTVLTGDEEGRREALRLFHAWRLKLYVNAVTENSQINSLLNKKLHRAKRYVVLSLPFGAVAGVFFFFFT